MNRALLQRPGGKGLHSVSYLAWLIMSKNWSERLEDSADKVRGDIALFFEDMRSDMPALVGAASDDLFASLTEADQRALTNNMLASGQDLSQLGEWSRNGDFVRYCEPATIVRIFASHPSMFFDGAVWNVAYLNLPSGLQASVVAALQADIKAQYLNCLEDCAAFLKYAKPEMLLTLRARVSLTFLQQRIS
jgi:hypothetical protein